MPSTYDDRRAKVVRVTDGDTIRVQYNDGTVVDVRLENINSPEIKNSYKGTNDQYYGQNAKTWLEDKLSVGDEVIVSGSSGNKDAYGRTVAYIFESTKSTVDRTQSLNYESVSSGSSRYYPYAGSYDTSILSAEVSATTRDVGLWNDPVYKILREELAIEARNTNDRSWRIDAAKKIPQIVATYNSGNTALGKVDPLYNTDQYRYMIEDTVTRDNSISLIKTFYPDVWKDLSAKEDAKPFQRVEMLTSDQQKAVTEAKAQELWRYSSIRLAGLLPSVVSGGQNEFGLGFGVPLSYTTPGWFFVNMPFFGWGWSEDPEIKRNIDVDIFGYRFRYDKLFGSSSWDPEGTRALINMPFGRMLGTGLDFLFRGGDFSRFANEFLFQGANIFGEGDPITRSQSVQEAARPVTFGERELFVAAAKASPDWDPSTGKWGGKYSEQDIYWMPDLELRKWARDDLTNKLPPTWENYLEGIIAPRSLDWIYPTADEAMYENLKYEAPMYPTYGLNQHYTGTTVQELPSGLHEGLGAAALYAFLTIPRFVGAFATTVARSGLKSALLGGVKQGIKHGLTGLGMGGGLGYMFGGTEGLIAGAEFGGGFGLIGGLTSPALMGLLTPFVLLGATALDVITQTKSKELQRFGPAPETAEEGVQDLAFKVERNVYLYPYGQAESWLQDYTDNVILDWWNNPNRRKTIDGTPNEPDLGVLDVDKLTSFETGFFNTFLGSFSRLQGRRQLTDLVTTLFSAAHDTKGELALAKKEFKKLQEMGKIESPSMPFPVWNPWESINAEAWEGVKANLLMAVGFEAVAWGVSSGAQYLVRKPLAAGEQVTYSRLIDSFLGLGSVRSLTMYSPSDYAETTSILSEMKIKTAEIETLKHVKAIGDPNNAQAQINIDNALREYYILEARYNTAMQAVNSNEFQRGQLAKQTAFSTETAESLRLAAKDRQTDLVRAKDPKNGLSQNDIDIAQQKFDIATKSYNEYNMVPLEPSSTISPEWRQEIKTQAEVLDQEYFGKFGRQRQKSFSRRASDAIDAIRAGREEQYMEQNYPELMKGLKLTASGAPGTKWALEQVIKELYYGADIWDYSGIAPPNPDITAAKGRASDIQDQINIIENKERNIASRLAVISTLEYKEPQQLSTRSIDEVNKIKQDKYKSLLSTADKLLNERDENGNLYNRISTIEQIGEWRKTSYITSSFDYVRQAEQLRAAVDRVKAAKKTIDILKDEKTKLDEKRNIRDANEVEPGHDIEIREYDNALDDLSLRIKETADAAGVDIMDMKGKIRPTAAKAEGDLRDLNVRSNQLMREMDDMQRRINNLTAAQAQNYQADIDELKKKFDAAKLKFDSLTVEVLAKAKEITQINALPIKDVSPDLLSSLETAKNELVVLKQNATYDADMAAFAEEVGLKMKIGSQFEAEAAAKKFIEETNAKREQWEKTAAKQGADYNGPKQLSASQQQAMIDKAVAYARDAEAAGPKYIDAANKLQDYMIKQFLAKELTAEGIDEEIKRLTTTPGQVKYVGEESSQNDRFRSHIIKQGAQGRTIKYKEVPRDSAEGQQAFSEWASGNGQQPIEGSVPGYWLIPDVSEDLVNYAVRNLLNRDTAVQAAKKRFMYTDRDMQDLLTFSKQLDQVERQTLLEEFYGSFVEKQTSVVGTRLVLKSTIQAEQNSEFISKNVATVRRMLEASYDEITGKKTLELTDSEFDALTPEEKLQYTIDVQNQEIRASMYAGTVASLKSVKDQVLLWMLRGYGKLTQELMSARGKTDFEFYMTDEMAMKETLSIDDYRKIMPDVVDMLEKSILEPGYFVKEIGTTGEKNALLKYPEKDLNYVLSGFVGLRPGGISQSQVDDVIQSVTNYIKSGKISVSFHEMIKAKDPLNPEPELTAVEKERQKTQIVDLTQEDVARLVARELKEPGGAMGAGFSGPMGIKFVTFAEETAIQTIAKRIYNDYAAVKKETIGMIASGAMELQTYTVAQEESLKTTLREKEDALNLLRTANPDTPGIDNPKRKEINDAKLEYDIAANNLSRFAETQVADFKRPTSPTAILRYLDVKELISEDYLPPTTTKEGLAVGTFVHRALEVFLGKPVAERTRAELERSFIWGLSQSQELKSMTEKQRQTVKDEARAILQQFFDHPLAQDIISNPGTISEHRFSEEIAGIPMVGRIDLMLRAQETIIDWKIRGVDYDLGSDQEIQMVTYAMAYEKLYHKMPKQMQYYILGGVNKQTGIIEPTFEVIDVRLDAAKLSAVLEKINKTGLTINDYYKTIERGIPTLDTGARYRLSIEKDPVTLQKLDSPIYGEWYSTVEEAMSSGIVLTDENLLALRGVFGKSLRDTVKFTDYSDPSNPTTTYYKSTVSQNELSDVFKTYSARMQSLVMSGQKRIVYPEDTSLPGKETDKFIYDIDVNQNANMADIMAAKEMQTMLGGQRKKMGLVRFVNGKWEAVRFTSKYIKSKTKQEIALMDDEEQNAYAQQQEISSTVSEYIIGSFNTKEEAYEIVVKDMFTKSTDISEENVYAIATRDPVVVETTGTELVKTSVVTINKKTLVDAYVTFLRGSEFVESIIKADTKTVRLLGDLPGEVLYSADYNKFTTMKNILTNMVNSLMGSSSSSVTLEKIVVQTYEMAKDMGSYLNPSIPADVARALEIQKQIVLLGELANKIAKVRSTLALPSFSTKQIIKNEYGYNIDIGIEETAILDPSKQIIVLPAMTKDAMGRWVVYIDKRTGKPATREVDITKLGEENYEAKTFLTEQDAMNYAAGDMATEIYNRMYPTIINLNTIITTDDWKTFVRERLPEMIKEAEKRQIDVTVIKSKLDHGRDISQAEFDVLAQELKDTMPEGDLAIEGQAVMRAITIGLKITRSMLKKRALEILATNESVSAWLKELAGEGVIEIDGKFEAAPIPELVSEEYQLGVIGTGGTTSTMVVFTDEAGIFLTVNEATVLQQAKVKKIIKIILTADIQSKLDEQIRSENITAASSRNSYEYIKKQAEMVKSAKQKFDLGVKMITEALIGGEIPTGIKTTEATDMIPWGGGEIKPAGAAVTEKEFYQYAAQLAYFQSLQEAHIFGVVNPHAYLSITDPKNPAMVGTGRYIDRLRASIWPKKTDTEKGIRSGYLLEGIMFIVAPEWKIMQYAIPYFRNLPEPFVRAFKDWRTTANYLRGNPEDYMTFGQKVKSAIIKGDFFSKEFKRNLTNIVYDTQFAYRITIAAFASAAPWINTAANIWLEAGAIRSLEMIRDVPSEEEQKQLYKVFATHQALYADTELAGFFKYDADAKVHAVSHLIESMNASYNAIELGEKKATKIYDQDQLSSWWPAPLPEHLRKTWDAQAMSEIQAQQMISINEMVAFWDDVNTSIAKSETLSHYTDEALQETMVSDWETFYPDLNIFEPGNWGKGLSYVGEYMDYLAEDSGVYLSAGESDKLLSIAESAQTMAGYYAGMSTKSDFNAALQNILNKIKSLNSVELPIEIPSDLLKSIQAETYFESKSENIPAELVPDTSVDQWASKAYLSVYNDSSAMAKSIGEERMKQLLILGAGAKNIATNNTARKVQAIQERLNPSYTMAALAKLKFTSASLRSERDYTARGIGGRVSEKTGGSTSGEYWSDEMVKAWNTEVKTTDSALEATGKEINEFLRGVGTGQSNDKSADISITIKDNTYNMTKEEYKVYGTLMGQYYDLKNEQASLQVKTPFQDELWFFKYVPTSKPIPHPIVPSDEDIFTKDPDAIPAVIDPSMLPVTTEVNIPSGIKDLSFNSITTVSSKYGTTGKSTWDKEVSAKVDNTINIVNFPGDPKILLPAVLSALTRFPEYCRTAFGEVKYN